MQYVSLGTTGLRVSRLSIGTAAFGLDHYGIPAPREGVVDSSEAIQAIRSAAESGINLFDTAPGYGHSEELLGQALVGRKDCLIATKVPIPDDIAVISSSALAAKVNISVDGSLRLLQREVLDIVQIHNATIPVLQQGELIACLERAREGGKLRYIGASVYGEETALAAVRTGKVQVLQIALNLLDQRMRLRLLDEAQDAGVGVLSRSALLKGALTSRSRWLPKSLRALSQACERVLKVLGTNWEALPSMALRFCLSLNGVHSVLVGVRSPTEVKNCIAAEAAGPLEPDLLNKAYTLALDDDLLLNPTYWDLKEMDTRYAQL
jgi:aryl-alcohol dehydrogenase-like predicted oxidoreductase